MARNNDEAACVRRLLRRPSDTGSGRLSGFVIDFEKDPTLAGAKGQVRAETGTFAAGDASGLVIKGQASAAISTRRAADALFTSSSSTTCRYPNSISCSRYSRTRAQYPRSSGATIDSRAHTMCVSTILVDLLSPTNNFPPPQGGGLRVGVYLNIFVIAMVLMNKKNRSLLADCIQVAMPWDEPAK